MRTLVLSLTVALACTAQAIEAPKPATQPAEMQAPRAAVSPTDETSFNERLQRVTHRRNLTGLKVSNEVLDALAHGDADVAVEMLAKAGADNRDGNIALVRMQHWCNRVVSARPGDPKAQIEKLPATLSAEKAARAAGVLLADVNYREHARAACLKARFDFGTIEARLRADADAGDPASATELSQFARDPAKRQQLLQTAIDKNYAPAMHALATSRLIAVQRGETTEQVASIRLLFKQAGRTLAKSRLELANCMALGCDGHPADAASAHAFGMDAARDGEPGAFLSMTRMPWGRRLTRAQVLGWQYFGDRLNESGCAGDAYVPGAIGFSQTIAALEKGQKEEMLQQARTQAEELWKSNAERAMQTQGCAQ